MSKEVKNARSTRTYASTSQISHGWDSQARLNNEAFAGPEFDGLTAFSLISEAHYVCDLVTVWHGVASLPDTYLLSIPRMPATIPRIPPTMNPPPIMKLSAANGNVMIAPIGPRLITIIMPPAITVSPEMRPIRTAIGCPRPDEPPNQKKTLDHPVGGPQKVGESSATEFMSIRIPPIIANTNPHMALLSGIKRLGA